MAVTDINTPGQLSKLSAAPAAETEREITHIHDSSVQPHTNIYSSELIIQPCVGMERRTETITPELMVPAA